MDNNILLNRIRKYQEEPVFHPLTCGNDSSHSNLQADIQNGKVFLFCTDCDYRQANIPDMFCHDDFDKLYIRYRNLLSYPKK